MGTLFVLLEDSRDIHGVLSFEDVESDGNRMNALCEVRLACYGLQPLDPTNVEREALQMPDIFSSLGFEKGGVEVLTDQPQDCKIDRMACHELEDFNREFQDMWHRCKRRMKCDEKQNASSGGSLQQQLKLCVEKSSRVGVMFVRGLKTRRRR